MKADWRLLVLPRAEEDAQAIFDYIHKRSPSGAVRWWDAYETAVWEIRDNPYRYGMAPENGLLGYELRQFLFKTPRGRKYRGVSVWWMTRFAF